MRIKLVERKNHGNSVVVERVGKSFNIAKQNVLSKQKSLFSWLVAAMALLALTFAFPPFVLFALLAASFGPADIYGRIFSPALNTYLSLFFNTQLLFGIKTFFSIMLDPSKGGPKGAAKYAFNETNPLVLAILVILSPIASYLVAKIPENLTNHVDLKHNIWPWVKDVHDWDVFPAFLYTSFIFMYLVAAYSMVSKGLSFLRQSYYELSICFGYTQRLYVERKVHQRLQALALGQFDQSKQALLASGEIAKFELKESTTFNEFTDFFEPSNLPVWQATPLGSSLLSAFKLFLTVAGWGLGYVSLVGNIRDLLTDSGNVNFSMIPVVIQLIFNSTIVGTLNDNLFGAMYLVRFGFMPTFKNLYTWATVAISVLSIWMAYNTTDPTLFTARGFAISSFAIGLVRWGTTVVNSFGSIEVNSSILNNILVWMGLNRPATLALLDQLRGEVNTLAPQHFSGDSVKRRVRNDYSSTSLRFKYVSNLLRLGLGFLAAYFCFGLDFSVSSRPGFSDFILSALQGMLRFLFVGILDVVIAWGHDRVLNKPAGLYSDDGDVEFPLHGGFSLMASAQSHSMGYYSSADGVDDFQCDDACLFEKVREEYTEKPSQFSKQDYLGFFASGAVKSGVLFGAIETIGLMLFSGFYGNSTITAASVMLALLATTSSLSDGLMHSMRL